MATNVAAEITGSVWKIEKGVGDRVEPGEAILVLESMKMEIPVESPCSGRVAEIRVSEGEQSWILFESAKEAILRHTYDMTQLFPEQMSNFDYTLGAESRALLAGTRVCEGFA